MAEKNLVCDRNGRSMAWAVLVLAETQASSSANGPFGRTLKKPDADACSLESSSLAEPSVAIKSAVTVAFYILSDTLPFIF